MNSKEKLQLWQERLTLNRAACDGLFVQMDRREEIYRGSRVLSGVVPGDKKSKAVHVRNVAAEMIDSQTDMSIPAPKVTPRRKQDEHKAKLIEDMIRGELDRLPFEQINDILSRTVPIQGGGAFLVEWDSEKNTHTTRGEIAVSAIHPRQIIPQHGVCGSIEEMDYVLLALPQTRAFLEKRFGVVIENEGERAEDVLFESLADKESTDMVTRYAAYYRNGHGGIGLFSWVGDTVLCDEEDYQCRRLKRCSSCGAESRTQEERCEVCGEKTAWERCDFEEILYPVFRSDGSIAVAGKVGEDGSLQPAKVPFYTPGLYPLIPIKNVSVYGSFWGESDIDRIADQQNTINRIESKIIDKLVKSGSYITLPDSATIKVDTDDLKVIRPGTPADKAMIDVYDMQGDISADMAYLAQVYEETRQIIGITDSFQGRYDRYAESGVARQFAASQSAGRLESKRVMRNAAYAALYEAIFKFKLAYCDEPRPVVSKDIHGNLLYDAFNRFDFLEMDEAGEYYWNDQFLFSCDDTDSLVTNRRAMWEETRENFRLGSFGDPTSDAALLLFWSKMEQLHYPGAAETKAHFKERQEEAAQNPIPNKEVIP